MWLSSNCNAYIAQYLKKSKQSMKLVQLIEYTSETFFLKNHTQNVVEKLAKPSSKKSKLSIFWINSVKFYTVYFYYIC